MAEALARDYAPPHVFPRMAVGVATRGRPEHVRRLVAALRRQTRRPAAILVAHVDPHDVAGLAPAYDLRLIRCEAGLTRQRNAILDALPREAEFVAFFDDDFLPHPQWLARAVETFEADPQVAGLTGRLLANGVCGAEIGVAPAQALLDGAEPDPRAGVEEGVSPYGCNMAFRLADVGRLRFDERLPLYGWLEDRDFATRVARGGGRLVRVAAALGVHLGVSAGRMEEGALGYAQIANPLHLLGRGTLSQRDFARRVLADVASNVLKAPRSVARARRLAGNLRALVHAFVGTCAPERAVARRRGLP